MLQANLKRAVRLIHRVRLPIYNKINNSEFERTFRTRFDRAKRVVVWIGQRLHPVAVPALWFGLLALSTGLIINAYLWLSSIPPIPNCKNCLP